MELGLLLDVARKFWTIDELKALIELISRIGLTHLQLHLSENTAFRLSLASMNGEGQENYSKEEIVELISFARARKIELVPDIDAPGHLAALLLTKPEFTLPETNGTALDVTNTEAVQWFLSILAEVADWFTDGQIFHIGGDEFIDFRQNQHYPYLLEKSCERFGQTASGLEFYTLFLNRMVALLTKKGKKARVWNDGLLRQDLTSLVPLTKEVEVCYWTNWDADMALASEFIEAGYDLINFCDNDLYYVLGENAGYTYPTATKLSDEAVKNKFSGRQFLTEKQMRSVKGTYFSVWSDVPEEKTVNEILEDLTALLPVFVQKYR